METTKDNHFNNGTDCTPTLPPRDATVDKLQKWEVPSAEQYKQLLVSKLESKRIDFQNEIKKNFLHAMHDEVQGKAVEIFKMESCPLAKMYMKWFREVIPSDFHPVPLDDNNVIKFQVSFPTIV